MNNISKIRSLGLDLDKLDIITLIEGKVVNRMPLRIGKPGELGEIDLPIQKLPDGTPYIPGSSFKGSLRSLAERLSERSCNIFSNLSECEVAAASLRKAFFNPYPRDMKRYLDQLYERSKSGTEEARRLLSDLLKTNGEEEGVAPEKVVEILYEKNLPCPICRIFGNKELASHILVRDMVPSNGPTISFRTRVAIDRFRRAARSGALFSYEFVSSGTAWNLTIKAHNLSIDERDEASKLFSSLLRYIKNFGLEVGGMKSVGHGLMEFEELRAKIYKIENFEVKEVEVKEVDNIEL